MTVRLLLTKTVRVLVSALLVQISISANAAYFINETANASIQYERYKSANDSIWDVLRALPGVTDADLSNAPVKSRGAPGVALFDYDNDDDIDIYVTNGPGIGNSLYRNLFEETGTLRFQDVAVETKTDLTNMDSSGVCFGDIDNDGDSDLLVLGAGYRPVLLMNLGGTFVDISNEMALPDYSYYSSGCSFGDIDNDGLLDVVIGNTGVDWDSQLPLNTPFDLNVHNVLLKNVGNNKFIDISVSSGLTTHDGFPKGNEHSAGFTWAIAMVDFDQDGDVDIVTADDQGNVPDAESGGVDRGLIHLFRNDGTGHFTDVSTSVGLGVAGLWMGIAFGDVNGDSHLDMFVTNIGDFMPTRFFDYTPGKYASRWFIGSDVGTFSDSGVSTLVATAFGWGTTIIDAENDADHDIIYHGGLDVGPFVDLSNPGTFILNENNSSYRYVADGFMDSAHAFRNVQGVAAGDLNGDGFFDVVSVSNSNFDPESNNTAKYEVDFGSSLDDDMYYHNTFIAEDGGDYVWSGYTPVNGDLIIDINQGNADNGWFTVRLLGTKDLLQNGHANRSGIGATIKVVTSSGKTVVTPVVGGASYASQDSLEKGFGLSKDNKADVIITWPGGVRNVLYGVTNGERLLLPELPCSFDDNKYDFNSYKNCVNTSIHSLSELDYLDSKLLHKIRSSAIKAFHDKNL